MDLIDMTGKDGLGWQPSYAEHRCSMPRCPNIAVVFYASTVGGYGWSKQVRHIRHKYVCADHLTGWGSRMYVIGDKVMREPFEWEHANG